MIGANTWPGDSSGWKQGVAQASVPVTNLAPHVDGGANSAMSHADSDAYGTAKYASALVLGALALLWFMGAFAFKSASL